MATESKTALVETYPLEVDALVDQLQRYIAIPLMEERGYRDLEENKRKEVDRILASIATMRFDSRDALTDITTTLLTVIAPELERYIPLAVESAEKMIPRKRGVLVIYTGGTIGSAPRDFNDADSPQVVKPWADLKSAAPQLGTLGYPVDAIAFETPLDSCNVGPQHWRTMAKIIEQYYSN